MKYWGKQLEDFANNSNDEMEQFANNFINLIKQTARWDFWQIVLFHHCSKQRNRSDSSHKKDRWKPRHEPGWCSTNCDAFQAIRVFSPCKLVLFHLRYPRFFNLNSDWLTHFPDQLFPGRVLFLCRPCQSCEMSRPDKKLLLLQNQLGLTGSLSAHFQTEFTNNWCNY